MVRLSGSKALSAGFGLIGREPAAFLVWCVVCFVLTVAPQILSAAPMFSVLEAVENGPRDLPAADLAAMQAESLRYQGLIWLASLLALALVPPAIFRAVLFPEDRGLMYLKLGAREFWSVLIVIVLIVMWVIAMLVGMIPLFVGIGVSGLAQGREPSGGGVLLAVLLILVFSAVLVWVALRLSMAPIMAFSDKTFRLTESWRLTRGHGGKLFLVAIALAVITLVVEMLIFGVFLGWAGSVVRLEDFGRTPLAVMTTLGAPFLAAAAVAASLFTGAFHAIWYGAWAEMYRQLSVKPEEVFD